MPGWNYFTYFVVKEGQARTYEKLAMFDAALSIYRRVRKLYSRFVKTRVREPGDGTPVSSPGPDSGDAAFAVGSGSGGGGRDGGSSAGPGAADGGSAGEDGADGGDQAANPALAVLRTERRPSSVAKALAKRLRRRADSRCVFGVCPSPSVGAVVFVCQSSTTSTPNGQSTGGFGAH